ncbi:MAG: DNA-directed RNA polymerase subunit beta' [Erythrobacter sp.]|nr:DNA-directed RNA polymerase subunit beta' [Erythrobacter sp.]
MSKPTRPVIDTSAILEKMAEPVLLFSLSPVAARFIHALRLIALHERVKRDPVPELAMRLGALDVAAKALALSQTVAATWPENVHVSRFCCQRLTHDEATIGTLIELTWSRDRAGFGAQIEGLIRPERVDRLWEAVLDLVAAEVNAA